MSTDRKAQRRSTSLTQYGLGIKKGDVDRDLILNAIQKMSNKKDSDLGWRRSTRTRREIAGRSVSPAVGRPEWLPEDWTMELKKRRKSCTKIKRIDRYYICPLSGKRLRSRLEVMRVLNNKFLDNSASESAPPRDGSHRQPSVELNRSEVKRTIARRHLFATEEPLSDAITGGGSTQEPALSSLTHASAQTEPISSFGTGEELKSPKTASSEEAQPIVGEEAHEKDSVEEEANCLNPFEEEASEGQHAEPTMPMEIETPETDQLKEKLQVAEPFVEQDSQEQLKNTLPFGAAWSDPCIEFAFKTLTSDFPVLDHYFNHQCISSPSLNLSVAPTSSLLGGSNPTSKKTM